MTPKIKHDLHKALGYTFVACLVLVAAFMVSLMVYVLLLKIITTGFGLYAIYTLGVISVIFFISYIVVCKQKYYHVEDEKDEWDDY
jgi:membrane protein YdbS with pleckstrin-like domain